MVSRTAERPVANTAALTDTTANETWIMLSVIMLMWIFRVRGRWVYA